MSVETEYQRLRLIKQIYQRAIQELDKNEYELKNILERWLLSLFNYFGVPESPKLLPTPTSSYVDDKAAGELVEKGFLTDGQAYMKRIWQQVENFKPEYSPGEITFTRQYFTYKDQSFERTPRLNYLILRWPKEAVMRMLLRYESYFREDNNGEHLGR